VLIPLEAEAPRIVVDRDDVWERSAQSTAYCSAVVRAVEALTVVVSVTSIV
jgi:hypothetical protein